MDRRKLEFFPFMSPVDRAKLIYADGVIIENPQVNLKDKFPKMFKVVMGEDKSLYWETCPEEIFTLLNDSGSLGMLDRRQRVRIPPYARSSKTFCSVLLKEAREAFNKLSTNGGLISECKFDPIPILGTGVPSLRGKTTPKLGKVKSCTRILLTVKEKADFFKRDVEDLESHLTGIMRRLQGTISCLEISEKKTNLEIIYGALIDSLNNKQVFPMLLGDWISNEAACALMAANIRKGALANETVLFGPKLQLTGS